MIAAGIVCFALPVDTTMTVFPLFRSPSALRLREPTESLRGGTHSARA